MMNIRLVVFDLDGTLVNSSRDLARATNALLRELGGSALPEEAVTAMVGEGAAVLVRRALSAAGLDPHTPGALERFLVLYDAVLLDNTRPYDGTVELLEWMIPRVPVAVLTNKPARATERVLEGLGLTRFFRQVIGGDTPFGRKPDPAALLHLTEASGGAASETILVGDSPIDLATARRAGARICLARYGFGYRFTDGDFRGDELFIDTPLELVQMFTREAG